MKKKKLRIIKDALHKNIPYTEIENYIFSSKIFNRLHSIHQNALAYMVYPSAEGSRFSHSIGVMHLASLIFGYSLLNAEESKMEEFVKTGKKEIQMILEEIKDGLYKKKAFPSKEIEGPEIDKIKKYLSLSKMGRLILKEKALQIFLLSCKPQKKERENYIILCLLLQALRISALLHDVGHLPFSHTSEEAIYDLIDYLESKIDKLKKKKDNESIDKIKKERIYRILVRYHKSDTKLHEIMTMDMSDLILNEEIVRYLKRDRDNNALTERDYYRYLALILLLREIVRNIFQKSTPYSVCKALRQIISGDIDADRLDFVARDLRISGLSEGGGGDIERIIKFYTLYEQEKDFYFLPSIRSLNNIEWFLENRYTLYRHIAYHHKVLLYNHILKKSIEALVREILEKCIEVLIKKGDSCDIDKKMEAHPILWLISILDKEEKDRLSQIFTFSRLDDHWLFSVLREKYFKLLVETSKKSGDKILEFFLSELFSGSKQLRSLWKRDYEFREFVIQSFLLGDKKFLSDLDKRCRDIDEIYDEYDNIQVSLEKEGNLTKDKREQIDEIKKELEWLKEELQALVTSIRKSEKDRIYQHFINILNTIKERKDIGHFIKKFEGALQKNFDGNYKIICAAEENDMIGITDFKLYEGRKMIDFDYVSVVHDYLQQKNKRMAQFYVYFPIDIPLTKNIIKRVRNIFAWHFGQYIKEFVNKIYDPQFSLSFYQR